VEYPIAHAWDILIVDDERPARSELIRMLRRTAPDARVREAGSVKEALGGIAVGMPDLLFLDIQMPGGDGFELLRRLGEKRPPVVFTTAYEQFASRAFEEDAIDYLLKPFDEKRLAKALSRVWTSANEAPKLTEGDSVLLKIDGECLLLPVEQIELIEATDEGTIVHWNGYSGRIGRTLGRLEEQLDPKMFFRASRDSLINLRFILSLRTDAKGELTALLSGNRSVTFSRRQKSLFQKTHKI
jgi:two-component system LytT family response regulator